MLVLQLYAIVSVVLPERCLVPTLVEDHKAPGAPFVPLIEGVAATADLEWVGPDPSLGVDLLEIHAIDLMSTNPKSEDLPGPLEGGSEGKHMDGGVDFHSLETITTAMKDALEEPLPALRVLQAMGRALTSCSRISPNDSGDGQLGLGAKLWEKEACVIKELVPLLLKPRCSRRLQETFCLWWQSLPSSGKEYLTPLLVISLRDPINSSNGAATRSNRSGSYFKKSKDPQLVSLSSSGLQQDPLGLLGCSAAVFRTPPLLGVVLELLIELLTASRRICQAAAIEGGRDGMKKEEVTSALAAQDRWGFTPRVSPCHLFLPNLRVDL
jgi:integrator complex subunit 2